MFDITPYIKHPQKLTIAEYQPLAELVSEYPYYQSARMLMLQCLYQMHDARFGEELRRAALYVSDRNALFQLFEGIHYQIKPHGRAGNLQQPSMDRTLSLIDDFLSQLPESVTETGATRPTAVDAHTDYIGYLESLPDAPVDDVAASATDDEQTSLIDRFIASHDGGRIQLSEPEDEVPVEMPVVDYSLESLPDVVDVDEDTVSAEAAKPSDNAVEISVSTPVTDEESDGIEPVDDSLLTETLARIYIKQRRYDKALDIIQRLSLKNPKKNVYFADQIRFLKKLIINNKNNK